MTALLNGSGMARKAEPLRERVATLASWERLVVVAIMLLMCFTIASSYGASRAQNKCPVTANSASFPRRGIPPRAPPAPSTPRAPPGLPSPQPGDERYKVPRLSEYETFLPAAGVARGVAYRGTGSRMRHFSKKLVEGRPVEVITLGGSTTAGLGAYLGGDYSARFEAWLQATFDVSPEQVQRRAEENGGNGSSSVLEDLDGEASNNATHRVLRRGMAAAPSAMFNICYDALVPPTGDLYVLEFAINDWWGNAFNAAPRYDLEQLIRRLLALPQRPAVVMLLQYAHFTAYGLPWNSDEHAQSFFGQYYDLPVLSMRNAVMPYIASGARGFQVDTNLLTIITDGKRANVPWTGTEDAEFRLLYHDGVHPADLTGHRVLSDLLVGLVRDSLADTREVEDPTAAAPMPFALPNNVDAHSSACFLQDSLRALAPGAQQGAWTWAASNPAAPSVGGQKWGWQASEPGAVLVLTLDSRVPAQPDKLAQLVLGLLRSKKRVGSLLVTCVENCTCDPMIHHPYWTKSSSQADFFKQSISQHEHCKLSLTVAEDTQTEGHLIVVRAVMVASAETQLPVDLRDNADGELGV